MAAFLAIALVIGLMPADLAMAVTGSQIAEDGTYTKTAHVTRTAEDDENEDEWEEYDVTVELKVADGIFSEITVTPGNGYDVSESQTYFAKAYNKSKGFQTLLTGQAASEDTINGWDAVSGATRTSDAIKKAALDAIHEAEEAKTPSEPEQPSESESQEPEQPSEPESQEPERPSESETQKPEQPSESESQEPEQPSESESQEPEQPSESETQEPAKPAETYILMNIPYADFYKADVNNSVPVDAFSSATLNKTRTASLAGGSYHVNADGSDITGITFPVKVGEGVDLSGYKQVDDNDSVEITVTNRGQTTTTTYTGQEALFENESYAYYVLSETPAYYKEVSQDGTGALSFGPVVGEVQTLTGIDAELMTETSYGDYQLDLDGLDNIDSNTDKVYAVIVSTKEGSDYGMRHLENIWRVSKLAWCTGFTADVHGCPTSSVHYESMMGETINKVTYYTSKGIFEIPVNDIYVPVKFSGSVKVEDADVDAGFTTVTVTGLPEDFDAEYRVDGLQGAAVADGILSYSTEAAKGQYTLTVTDRSGKYAPMSTSFILTTTDMPAAYNGNDEAPALVAAEGFGEEAFADYLKNISTVTVNGEVYAASGRGSVVIINEDGTLNLEAASGETVIFAENGTYEITVSSTGYHELTFIYTKSEAAAPAEPSDKDPAHDGNDDVTTPEEPSDKDPAVDDDPNAAAPGNPSNSGNDGTNASGSSNQNGTANGAQTGAGNGTQTGTGQQTVQSDSTVETGDSSIMYLWLALLFMSLCGGGYVAAAKRRRDV